MTPNLYNSFQMIKSIKYLLGSSLRALDYSIIKFFQFEGMKTMQHSQP